VEVYIENLDDANNFYGIVKLIDNPQFDISIELLKRGLAHFVDWSVSRGVDVNELRNSEEVAKTRKLKIWKEKNMKKNVQRDNNNNLDISGKVVEIYSAGAIKVLPKGSKRDSKLVRFSSIRVPRVIYDDEVLDITLETENRQKKLDQFDEDKANSVYSIEAKEFLRKKLIGQTVECIYDYSATDNPNTKYFSVYSKDSNVAIELLEQGFGKVANHFDDQPRSRDYQKLIYAQNRAMRVNKGIHSSLLDKPSLYINDLTSKPDPSRAQLYLSHLKRSGRVSAVIEQVIGASRFRVFFPSDHFIVILSLHGLFCAIPERVDTKSSSIYDIYPPDIPGNRGLHYSRELLYQRDVEVAVNDVDRRCNFHGRVYFQGHDIALSLLEQGFAKLNNETSPSMEEYKTYKECEDKAKTHKDGPQNMWENWDPKEEAERENKKTQEKEERQKRRELQMECMVTEITDGSNFYFQIIGPETEKLKEMMDEIHNIDLDNQAPYEPAKGEFIFAKFVDDQKYYRARVNYVNDKDKQNVQYRVSFIDYGNSDLLHKEDIRRLDNSKFGTKVLKAQAQTGRLAFVKAPKIDEEFGKEAADLLKSLVWKEHLIGKYWVDRNNYYNIKLGVPSKKIFASATMVTEGYARVTRSNTEDPVYTALKEAEEQARKSTIGIWVYGAVPDSEEEKEEELLKKKEKEKKNKQDKNKKETTKETKEH